MRMYVTLCFIKKKMRTAKEIWNDQELRCGGFYELAIEISENNLERKEVIEYLKSLFEIESVDGPFDHHFNKSDYFVDTENGYGENLGYLEIEGVDIPFKTVFISEEGEEGSNWIDICFYTAIYEELLGNEYKTWATDAKWHKGFDDKLILILKHLNSIRKVRIGLIGFEISGEYYLKTLKDKELSKNDVSHTKFFVNKEEEIKPQNWKFVNQI